MKCSILFAASLCTACSTLPTAQKVEDLGSAVAASSAVFRSAATTNRNLALRIGEEDQAARFLRRSSFTLSDSPDAMLNPARFRPRLEALAALEEYGKALKLAADKGVAEELEQASVRLGTATSTFVGAASPASAPVAGPALKLVSRSFGFLLGNAYAGEIQAVIIARDPDVKELVRLLKVDLDPIADLLAQQLDDFELQRKVNLMLVRDDRKVDRLRLYYEYKAARQEVTSQRALVLAVAKYNEVLDSLVAAHEALATSAPDADLALKRFVALTNDLVDLVVAVAKEDKK